jgi:hypothetical protein
MEKIKEQAQGNAANFQAWPTANLRVGILPQLVGVPQSSPVSPDPQRSEWLEALSRK